MPWFSCVVQNRLTVRGNNSQGYKVDCKIAIRIFVVWRVKELIEKGETKIIKGFKSKKTGKKFDSKLKLSDGKLSFNFDKGE